MIHVSGFQKTRVTWTRPFTSIHYHLMCPLLGKYGKTWTLTCQKCLTPMANCQPPPPGFAPAFLPPHHYDKTKANYSGHSSTHLEKNVDSDSERHLIHSYSFIWNAKSKAGCNNNINHLIETSLQFDIIWPHVSVRRFLHLKKQEMIWKTSLVAIGLKWMGHVVRLFRVGAIPNGDPSSRVPYSNSMSSYYENLPRKNISRVPWTMMYLPMAALEETKAGSWNEQRAFETFPSYDQVGAVLTLQTKTVLNVRFMIHIEWFFPDSLGDLTSPHSLMT